MDFLLSFVSDVTKNCRIINSHFGRPPPLHSFASKESDRSPVERLPQRCILGPVLHEAHIQPSDWSHIILTGAATTRSRPTSDIIAKYDRYGTNPRRAVRRRRTLRHASSKRSVLLVHDVVSFQTRYGTC